MMLNKSITYRSLLRFVGVLFLLWAFYRAFGVATTHIYENGDTFWRYEIETSLTGTLFDAVYYGVLFFVAAGVLVLGLSSRYVSIAYWSIQITVWLVGISIWYRSNNTFTPYPQDLFWLFVTVICSLVLLVFYIPIVLIFRRALKGASASSKV